MHRVALADGAPALIGDEVQTRRNDRSLMSDVGITLNNRQRWIVDGVCADRSSRSFTRSAAVSRCPTSSSPTRSRSPTPRRRWSPRAHGRPLPDPCRRPDRRCGSLRPDDPGPPRQRRLDRRRTWLARRCHRRFAEVMQRRWIDEPAISQLTEALDAGPRFDSREACETGITCSHVVRVVDGRHIAELSGRSRRLPSEVAVLAPTHGGADGAVQVRTCPDAFSVSNLREPAGPSSTVVVWCPWAPTLALPLPACSPGSAVCRARARTRLRRGGTPVGMVGARQDRSCHAPPRARLVGDVRDLRSLPKVDVVAAGFP